ncbi:hypothetical protein BKA58DRAFT_106922 [Alternaria rosae]|uniref:uncharacterized protein n=1 Tax=Alternaria rosae TaxID=1187941 RepID=UPI001E8E8544|nr:uncharacterized protein BKA58DRAFT_106922 [Alternaria rosae]KAH6878958.1 hypothetical protein BKA58DRAFT_106922 [Alternaria rosae]
MRVRDSALRLLLVSAARVGARRMRCNLACNTAEPPLRTKYVRHAPKQLSFRHPLRLRYFGRSLKPCGHTRNCKPSCKPVLHSGRWFVRETPFRSAILISDDRVFK